MMRRDEKSARVEIRVTTADERTILDIADGFPEGIKATAWQKLARVQGISRASFYRLLSSLKKKRKVVLEDGRYRVDKPQDVVVSTGLKQSHETSETTGCRGLVSQVSPPLGGVIPDETGAPTQEPPSGTDTETQVPFVSLSAEEKRRRFKENVARAYREN